jgi:hypothetical protein
VQCPWEVGAVLQNAAHNGGTELLAWLQLQVGAASMAANGPFMLELAATHDNLEAVQWLRQHAAAE